MTERIIDYVIAGTLPGDIPNVNTLLIDGWQPYGSPAWSPEGLLVQAMVKYARQTSA